jgi:hypothetical protein
LLVDHLVAERFDLKAQKWVELKVSWMAAMMESQLELLLGVLMGCMSVE